MRPIRFLAVLFTFALSLQAFAQYNFTVYRALSGDKKNDCITGPQTNPGQFKIDADGLSTFQAGIPLDPTRPYRLSFAVTNAPHDPPQQGDTGAVANINGQQYTATYTPNLGGPGHWSINNDRTTEEKKQDFSVYAKTSGNISRNPDYNNVVPYCPNAPLTRTRFAKD